MPTQEIFDVTEHIDQEVGWVTLFPSSKDWTAEPTYVLISHLKEVRDTFKLVSLTRYGDTPPAQNVRYRTVQYLATQVPRGTMNNLAQSADKHARLIDKYIEQLEASLV
jgi:hypothetical protein